MGFHIALSLPTNLDSITRDAQAGIRPRHVMWGLSQRLGATIHAPGGQPTTAEDDLLSKVIGQPHQWALARSLTQQLTSDDVVFCIGEDIGVPLVAACSTKKVDRPKVAVFVHNMNRPRGRLALKMFNIAKRADLLVTFTLPQYNFLQQYLKLPESKLFMLHDQTDTQFFTPGPASPTKSRPVIASGGMEVRDYYTLARATWDLDVDVKICAFSRNAEATARTFPRVLPSNMTHGFYDWADLRQLYRDADVVAISLFDNNRCAGSTTLLESLSCKRPVVMTLTPGPVEELAAAGCVIGVPPADPDRMRQAITWLLNHPEEAAKMAQRGYEYVTQNFSADGYIDRLSAKLTSLLPKPSEDSRSSGGEMMGSLSFARSFSRFIQ